MMTWSNRREARSTRSPWPLVMGSKVPGYNTRFIASSCSERLGCADGSAAPGENPQGVLLPGEGPRLPPQARSRAPEGGIGSLQVFRQQGRELGGEAVDRQLRVGADAGGNSEPSWIDRFSSWWWQPGLSVTAILRVLAIAQPPITWALPGGCRLQADRSGAAPGPDALHVGIGVDGLRPWRRRRTGSSAMVLWKARRMPSQIIIGHAVVEHRAAIAAQFHAHRRRCRVEAVAHQRQHHVGVWQLFHAQGVVDAEAAEQVAARAGCIGGTSSLARTCARRCRHPTGNGRNRPTAARRRRVDDLFELRRREVHQVQEGALADRPCGSAPGRSSSAGRVDAAASQHVVAAP